VDLRVQREYLRLGHSRSYRMSPNHYGTISDDHAKPVTVTSGSPELPSASTWASTS
jgi:hypothetical protein